MRIVILGAGPAGTSCAIQLLKAGFDVTLLERQNFPRNMPGETLHPGIESLLRKLQVFDAVYAKDFIRHEGISVISNNKEEFEYYNEKENWKGFQLYRKEFDEILLKKALELGANYSEQVLPRSIITAKGGIKAIVTNNRTITGDIFIDATGRRSWLAHQLKIKYHIYSPKLLVYYGYVFSDENIGFNNPKLIWDKKGWTWISRVTEEIICWNRLCSFDAGKLCKEWLPEDLRKNKPLESRGAVDVTWRIAQNLSAKNYFLIGDSAFILDPSSSHGVLKAIMSGIMVAYLLKSENNNEFTRFQSHNYYKNWMNIWFERDLHLLKDIYIENKVDFFV